MVVCRVRQGLGQCPLLGVAAVRSGYLHGRWRHRRSLVSAFCAATDSCQMALEVFFSVIIGKLFARLDCAEGEEINSTIADPDPAIRIAGVIDEASGIRRNVSVDHARVTGPEEVLPAILLDLFGCGWSPKVFDYE